MTRFTSSDLANNLRALGLAAGDRVLVRAALKPVGRISGGAPEFLQALLDAVGPEGTVVSLAFTDSTFARRPDPALAFHDGAPSNAGALPNAMLAHPQRRRSRHPTCSIVAIGADAEIFVAGHDEHARAYEPVRHLLDARGKCMLVGCVASSPGFTTAHLAEADLGLHRRVILPRLNQAYYRDQDGALQLFRRSDPGLCSMAFYKFYAHYVRHGILRTGFVGQAYSILGPAREAYEVEREVLSRNPVFGICDSPDCFTCNAGRWDRLHRLPGYALRQIARRIRRSEAPG